MPKNKEAAPLALLVEFLWATTVWKPEIFGCIGCIGCIGCMVVCLLWLVDATLNLVSQVSMLPLVALHPFPFGEPAAPSVSAPPAAPCSLLATLPESSPLKPDVRSDLEHPGRGFKLQECMYIVVVLPCQMGATPGRMLDKRKMISICRVFLISGKLKHMPWASDWTWFIQPGLLLGGSSHLVSGL